MTKAIALPTRRIFASIVLFAALFIAAPAYADHSWGNYHWARTTSALSLSLGDNLSSSWDPYLVAASADWSISAALDTTIVSGKTAPRTCRGVNGRVEVCNSKYGSNGWLGIASIWVNGAHITQATVKLNDTYFNKAAYNTPAWKQFVMCQEVGHAFGLDHQDEAFGNTNVGSCMDYTNDPSGALSGQLSNTAPNAHDYEQLAAIYAHLDTFGTALTQLPATAAAAASDLDTTNASERGREVRKSRDGRTSVYARDLGRGQMVFTFIVWADDADHENHDH